LISPVEGKETTKLSFVGYQILRDKFPYTGQELSVGWIRKNSKIDGGAAVAWVGPCRVETDDMVDLDDVKAGSYVEAAQMAHIIIEHLNCTMQAAVLRQRLLVCILAEVLRKRGVQSERDGDDLYVDGRKLTVSIAAPSRGGTCLIHLGINVDPAGSPVPAVGLDELGVPPYELLESVLGNYRSELADAAHAEIKVRAVR
jgi:hypothetical protein